jgi:hypothetical protein
LESRCHPHSLFGTVPAIPDKGITAIAAQGVLHDHTIVTPTSATTRIRAVMTTTRTRPAIFAGTITARATIDPAGAGATTTAIIGVSIMVSDTIIRDSGRGSDRINVAIGTRDLYARS